MKKMPQILFILMLCTLHISCEKNGGDHENGNTFIEPVADTTFFTNAEFIYNGDDIGEATSDGWVIKMYTDMDIDEAGAPVGPGAVLQMLLNVEYNEQQDADAAFLPGTYREMYNSGNFVPCTFVSGYISQIDLPGGERLELADATFYADVMDGSTEMDYDLIDEGALTITDNEDGTYTIKGILVGGKFTKRHFSWTGEVEPRNNVPQETPNSTLSSDISNPEFTKGLLQDKGDCFYLGDQSYRCLLLFLADDPIVFSYGKPAGSGKVLRLEITVPWETDVDEGGIPEGTYTMTTRNQDTSIDRDKIVPGIAIPGLPNVFAAWKMAGAWYYEMQDGNWTDTYARIDNGTVTVSREDDGSHVIEFDLLDCQKNPRRISGTVTLNGLERY